MAQLSLQQELQRLAKRTPVLTETQAANVWAGTTGLELQAAINVACSTTALPIQQALNKKAGTSQLDAVHAASQIPTP